MNEYVNVPPKFTRVHSLRNKMSITRGAEFGESILFTLNLTCSKIIANHICSVIKTPLLIHIKYSQTYTEAILIVLSFYCPLKKERKKKTGAGKFL